MGFQIWLHPVRRRQEMVSVCLRSHQRTSVDPSQKRNDREWESLGIPVSSLSHPLPTRGSTRSPDKSLSNVSSSPASWSSAWPRRKPTVSVRTVGTLAPVHLLVCFYLDSPQTMSVDQSRSSGDLNVCASLRDQPHSSPRTQFLLKILCICVYGVCV